MERANQNIPSNILLFYVYSRDSARSFNSHVHAQQCRRSLSQVFPLFFSIECEMNSMVDSMSIRVREHRIYQRGDDDIIINQSRECSLVNKSEIPIRAHHDNTIGCLFRRCAWHLKATLATRVSQHPRQVSSRTIDDIECPWRMALVCQIIGPTYWYFVMYRKSLVKAD